MEDRKILIAIGRQTGAGGRSVGKALAEKLGISYYDKELLDRAAEESGFAPEILERHDEKPTHSFLYSLIMDSHGLGIPAGYGTLPLDHQIFLAEFNTIKKIAAEESCVIVGRCADYALEGDPDLLTVFLYAEEDDKIHHMMEESGMSETKTREMIMKKDHMRANYYNYFSNKKWGNSNTYDLCVNTTTFGYDGAVEIILKALEKRKVKTSE